MIGLWAGPPLGAWEWVAPGAVARLHPGPLTGHGAEEEAGRGLEGHRDDRIAVDGESHEGVEVVAAGDDVAGAVERIGDPALAVRPGSLMSCPPIVPPRRRGGRDCVRARQARELARAIAEPLGRV
jgi:hypothetical protein